MDMTDDESVPDEVAVDETEGDLEENIEDINTLFDEDTPNIEPLLRETQKGKEELARIYQRVMDRYKTSWDSMKTFRSNAAEASDLYAGNIKTTEKSRGEIQAHL